LAEKVSRASFQFKLLLFSFIAIALAALKNYNFEDVDAGTPMSDYQVYAAVVFLLLGIIAILMLLWAGSRLPQPSGTGILIFSILLMIIGVLAIVGIMAYDIVIDNQEKPDIGNIGQVALVLFSAAVIGGGLIYKVGRFPSHMLKEEERLFLRVIRAEVKKKKKEKEKLYACPSCGHPVQEDYQFCPMCAEAFGVEETPVVAKKKDKLDKKEAKAEKKKKKGKRGKKKEVETEMEAEDETLVTCPKCSAISRVTTSARPVTIRCPSCGTTGTIN